MFPVFEYLIPPFIHFNKSQEHQDIKEQEEEEEEEKLSQAENSLSSETD